MRAGKPSSGAASITSANCVAGSAISTAPEDGLPARIIQVIHRPRIESELLLGHRRVQLCARAVVWLIKHVRAAMLAKVARVLRRQERALVMIKPPGQLRRIGILEIHDDVLIAIK